MPQLDTTLLNVTFGAVRAGDILVSPTGGAQAALATQLAYVGNGNGKFTTIAGNAASLDLDGLGAAQGGSVTMTGGTSSTSANPGGAVIITGGTPGATGIGGSVTIAGGAGLGGATGGALALAAGAGQGTATGATASLVGGASGAGATGNGGISRIVGGAASSTNGAGGAAQVTGGAGAGSGAGGAVTIASGAGGATGVAGAMSIVPGTAGSGAGAIVTITGGAGAGGTSAGGDVNITGGAAVSTGQPGEVKVNNDANLIFATYFFTGTPAATSQVFFLATRAVRVKTISCIFSTAAGGVSTLDVTKDTGTGAPASGSSLFQSGTFNLNATANTVQNATVSTTIATATLAAGDRISVKFNHAIQASAGVVVTVGMVPV